MWQMWLVWRLWVLSKVTAAGLRQHYSVKTYISSYNSRYNYSYCIHICMNQPNPVWRNSSHYTPVFYSYYLLDVNERKDLITPKPTQTCLLTLYPPDLDPKTLYQSPAASTGAVPPSCLETRSEPSHRVREPLEPTPIKRQRTIKPPFLRAKLYV